MKHGLETVLGFIVLIICIVFLKHSLKFSSFYNGQNEKTKSLCAVFNNVEGIKIGSDVKIGGTRVGTVSNISLNKNTFQVKINILVDDNIQISTDAILAVTSSGIFGNKYLTIKQGIEEDYLKDGACFFNTQSSTNLEDLISKFATGAPKSS
jgi:phospholipid/cholesterol/gamma-HCH transport system substrate-binding protein